MNSARAIFLALLMGIAGASSAQPRPMFKVVEVPNPTDGTIANGSFPGGINNAGQVSGTLRLINGSQEAFLYSKSTGTQPLGFLSNALLSIGYGINASGQVTGWSFNQYGQLQAFIYTSGLGMQGLPAALGGTGTEGRDINDAGSVVGKANTAIPYEWNAFKYGLSGGTTFVNIGGGTSSEATAINNSGTVAGFATGINGNPNRQAFTTSDDGVLTALGFLEGGSWSYANDLNDSGQVVGYSTSSFGGQAFLYSKQAGMRGLGMLAGSTYAEALAINAAGQVVGVSYTPGLDRAFLYSSGVMYSINELLLPEYSSYNISYAADINDLGQIVAYANGRTVVLTPVPETSSFAQLTLGLLLLIVIRRVFRIARSSEF